jgi:hypothetical protein
VTDFLRYMQSRVCTLVVIHSAFLFLGVGYAMRVLLVAPRSNLLSVDEEIQDVMRSGLTVTPLLGNVSATDLIRDIKARDYDCLWLATHGNSDGIELSNGEMFPATELVAHVRERFSLVVLNTCDSLGIAQLFQEEANVGVICTLLKVPDTLAYRTGSRLAAALYETSTVAEAFLASRPGRNREYLYLPSLLPSQDSFDSLLVEMRTLKEMFERQRTWERRALLLALGLHPVSWLVWWFILITWRL